MMHDRWFVALAAIPLILASGCSKAGAIAPDDQAPEASAQTASTGAAEASRQPFIEAGPTPSVASDKSSVIGKRDVTEDGAPACMVDFVYAGMEPESLVWKEACSDVMAEMVDQQTLTQWNKWERLDQFDRDFVNAMPGAVVLYVGGEFSASVYPIGTNGLSYEVSVAD